MPRRGRYWHTDKKKSWNKSGDEERPRPPPGLRGREIGLFYRDLQRNKPKREFSMNLAIPSRVLNHVEELIKKIEITAKSQDIDIEKILTLPNWDLLLTEHNADISAASTSGRFKIPALKEKRANTSPTLKVSSFLSLYSRIGADFLDSSSSMEGVERALAPKEPITEDLPSLDFVPIKVPSNPEPEPSSSEVPDFVPVETHYAVNYGTTEKLLSMRPSSKDYKYGYYDIITESFDEKLEASLSQGIIIDTKNSDTLSLNESLYLDYCDMLKEPKYTKMLEFRKKLPTYNKTKDILDMVKNNQVILISGETGCGKSTQVPQILLDNALSNKEGGNMKIMVTEPRRIAASSLAERVAAERAEPVGRSVGYAVRLEKINPRLKGSIVYCTTGILLNDLEVDQALTNYSHIILDEVHERDTHIDLAMCILKKIMFKRKDLKLILMSATLDAATLSAYFDDCPILHIEGLAYPVKDIYMEEILKLTGFRLEEVEYESQSSYKHYNNKRGKGHRPQHNKFQAKQMEKEIQYRVSIDPWLQSIKHNLDRDIYRTLWNHQIEEINYDLIVQLLVYINNQEQGAVLIFLPGINEITKLMTAVKEHGMFNSSRYAIYPLHSKLPSLEQRKIFERPPEGVRKIIIATNIAETSITIDDIVYVIDCGKLKLKGLNVQDNVQTLNVEWISQANLRQRRGRAGRCQPGICYHLLTSYRVSKLEERILPELQRSNLLEPVLSVKQLRLGKAEDALQMVPDPPALSTIQWAVRHLQQCGALDDKEVLTPLGWHLARLPVHPAAGKLLLFGALFGCLDRAASVAAVWGFKDPFLLIIGNDRDKAQDTKRELAMGEPSDHIAMAEAIIRWERLGHERRTFAYRNFLSNHTLELLSEMKNQFGDNLKQMGFLATNSVRGGWVNRNKDNLSLFKAIVAASLYPNIATVRWSNLNHRNPNKPPRMSARTPEEGRVDTHPSSVMSSLRGGKMSKPLCANPGANWLAYWIKQKSTNLFLIDVTLVYTLPLLFFGEFKVSNVADAPEFCHISISTIKVKCHKDTAALLLQLRSLLDYVLANKVMSTSDDVTKHNDFEHQVLNAVIAIITAEDEQAEFVGDEDDGSESDQSDVEHKQRKWRY